MDITDAQDLWSPEPGWLNTATYGLPPRPAWDQLQQALSGWRSGTAHREAWEARKSDAGDVRAQIGLDAIRRHNVALANRFLAGLDRAPSNSAIATVDLPGANEKLDRAGVRASVRNGNVRVAFHVYTTETDVDLALEALSS